MYMDLKYCFKSRMELNNYQRFHLLDLDLGSLLLELDNPIWRGPLFLNTKAYKKQQYT